MTCRIEPIGSTGIESGPIGVEAMFHLVGRPTTAPPPQHCYRHHRLRHHGRYIRDPAPPPPPLRPPPCPRPRQRPRPVQQARTASVRSDGISRRPWTVTVTGRPAIGLSEPVTSSVPSASGASVCHRDRFPSDSVRGGSPVPGHLPG